MQSRPLDFFTTIPVMDLSDAMSAYSLFVRGLFLVGFSVYVLFAFLVVRQVYLMDQTIKTPLAPILKLVAWLHLFVVIGATLLLFTAL